MDFGNDKSIIDFWDWFESNSQSFGPGFRNKELVKELDDRVLALGLVAWELGPGMNTDKQFVISPGGKQELLPLTKHFISLSKPIEGWEFYYAKPPKNWEFQFYFESERGIKIVINASDWEYVLLAYDDRMFEIIIRANNLDNLSETDKLTAAEILLDGVLGEERRLLYIDFIEVVSELEEEFNGKKSSIKVLNEHLYHLAEN